MLLISYSLSAILCGEARQAYASLPFMPDPLYITSKMTRAIAPPLAERNGALPSSAFPCGREFDSWQGHSIVSLSQGMSCFLLLVVDRCRVAVLSVTRAQSHSQIALCGDQSERRFGV